MSLDMNAAFRIRASVDGQAQLDRFNQALRQAGQQGEMSAGQIRNAYRMLPAQFTDIATQLAGGQNPFLILLQQGGQIRDSFGGVGAALRGVASFITPFTVGVTAAAGAVSALAMAFIQGEQETVNFNRALAITNNYAGQTADRFAAAAQRIEEASGITNAAARELLQGAIGSGRFGPQSIEAVTRAMGQLQRLTGMTADEAQKVYEKMASGTAEWARQANQTYNFLDAAQYRYIRQLEEAGNKEEAMRVAAEALDAALAKRTVELGTLESAWKKVTNAASSAWSAMLNIGREETPQQKLEALQRELEARQARGALMGGSNAAVNQSFEKGNQRLRDEIANLQEVIRLQGRAADAASGRAQSNQKAIEDEKKRLDELKKREGKLSEFDRLKQNLDSQLLATRELGVAEQLLAEIQMGRYRELTPAQQQELVGLARKIDIARTQKEYDEAEAERVTQITNKRAAAAEQEDRQMKAAAQNWADLANPVNKYQRQLEEIQNLVARGYLSPELGMDAEFEVLNRMGDELDRLKGKGKDAFKELADAVNGWGRQATDAFIDFAFKGKLAVGDLVQSVLADIARMLIQQSITKPLFSALSGAIGSFFPSLGGAAGSSSFSLSSGASGLGLKLPSYDVGTPYVPSDQLAMVHKGEAIIPAKYNNGSLGGSTQVIVNNYSGAQATARETVDSRGRRRVEVTVSEMVAGEMSRPGSSVNNAVRSSFGARPALVGR